MVSANFVTNGMHCWHQLRRRPDKSKSTEIQFDLLSWINSNWYAYGIDSNQLFSALVSTILQQVYTDDPGWRFHASKWEIQLTSCCLGVSRVECSQLSPRADLQSSARFPPNVPCSTFPLRGSRPSPTASARFGTRSTPGLSAFTTTGWRRAIARTAVLCSRWSRVEIWNGRRCCLSNPRTGDAHTYRIRISLLSDSMLYTGSMYLHGRRSGYDGLYSVS